MAKGYNKYSDEELLNIIKDYYTNVGFPTQREFNSKNGLPCYVTYYNRFGSFKNAVLMAGIPIPPERERYFNRDKLTDEEMLYLLKYYTEKKLKNNLYLLTNEDIDGIPNMPSSSTYMTRFGGVVEAYKLIGYDYYEFNNSRLEDDMIVKLKELAAKLGRTPSSRDITKYSKMGECYATETYCMHFGTLYNAQIICGLAPTRVGNNKTREELIYDLKQLYKKNNRLPTHQDIDNEEGVASASKYADEFGSLVEALRLAGVSDDEINSRAYITDGGVVCYSVYEHKFASMLEDKKIEFKKEPLYREYIKDFDKKYRFDFEIIYKNKKYLIEIFGITTIEEYHERTREKIELCRSNGVPLISLYPDIFWTTTQDGLFLHLQEKIEEVDRIYYTNKVI